MTNQKIRVVVPFKTLKKKIYDEASRKCIVKKNATLEEILNDLRSHDISTYIIGRDERSGREGSIPEWANIHPRKQTVESL